MLSSRGQENLVHARPVNGKALQPKTPGNFQTPRTTNRAPLGAKTTNAKAQPILNNKNNAKLQVFKTPAPGQQRNRLEKSVNRPSTTRRSARSKITVAPTEPLSSAYPRDSIDDDEPDFGYAPPPPVELPDPPMEFGYDETFPQFRPENIFRGYGEIYFGSPKDENGFSIRLKKEEEEYQQYQERQAEEYTKRIRQELLKHTVTPDDDLDLPKSKIKQSNPNTIKARSAVAALSGIRAPAVADKQTESSRLKMNRPVTNKPLARKTGVSDHLHPKPLSVSRNTIGFPKAKQAPSIVSQQISPLQEEIGDADTLADDLSDFEFSPLTLDDGEDVFQLPMPE